MKIALIGYGKMGQMVERVALHQGHSVVARITSNNWDAAALQHADVCIDFTNPESAVSNIRRLAPLKKEIVIGTTGWYDQLELVAAIVKEHHIGALYAPNFSIGVNLFLEFVARAAKMIQPFKEYDVAGVELHHNQKKDSPSGTALAMARAVEQHIDHIDNMPISSVRCGSITGTHTVLFDSPHDTISVTHEAKGREGFAEGAVHAANWLRGRKGLYTFADCMQSIIQGKVS